MIGKVNASRWRVAHGKEGQRLQHEHGHDSNTGTLQARSAAGPGRAVVLAETAAAEEGGTAGSAARAAAGASREQGGQATSTGAAAVEVQSAIVGGALEAGETAEMHGSSNETYAARSSPRRLGSQISAQGTSGVVMQELLSYLKALARRTHQQDPDHRPRRPFREGEGQPILMTFVLSVVMGPPIITCCCLCYLLWRKAVDDIDD